jgi:hypothetical protein
MTRLGRSALIGLALSLPAGAAHSYYYLTCDGDKIDWQSNTKTLRAHTVSFEQDAMRDALETQVERFNFNPSKFRLDLSLNEGSVAFANEQNEIWFSFSQDLLDERPGATQMRYKCTNFKSEFVEMDVVLQGDFSLIDWSYTDDRASLSAYGGENRALRTTLMHELGHVMGLLHTIETYGVMGNSSRHNNTNGSRSRTYLGEDGSSGAVKLYGTASSSVEDVGVSHWKFKASGDDPFDDYSEHTRTRVYDSNGDLIEAKEGKDGENHYEVRKGQTIQVEFTYENNGQDEQTVSAGYYLSGNNKITTGDLFLDDRPFTLSRNTAHVHRKTVTIPAWVPSGLYFVGVVIDYDNKLSEKTANNNATYIGIKVLKEIDEI